MKAGDVITYACVCSVRSEKRAAPGYLDEAVVAELKADVNFGATDSWEYAKC